MGYLGFSSWRNTLKLRPARGPMANADCVPSIRVRPVIDSLQLINIHVIENRAYYVYVNALCVSGCIILRFDSRAVASCICGDTVAIVLESGNLLVPLARTLVYCESTDVCEEAIGMTSHRLFRRKVAATSSGSYIAVNVSKTSIMVYKFDGKTLSFCRSVNVPRRGSFQIMGEQVPYIWHLYPNEDSYRIDVFEASEFSSVKYPDEPIAKCPMLVGESSHKISSFDESKCFLHACDSSSLEGMLCFIEGKLIYLSLKSAIIGNLFSGLIRFPSTWLAYVCTTRYAKKMHTYVCNQNDRKVFEITSTVSGTNFEPTISHSVGKVPFNVSSKRKFHIAIVDTGSGGRHESPESNNSGNYRIENADKSVTILCEPARTGRIKQFAIESRKLPRRVLVLSESSIDARVSATPVKTTACKLVANDIQNAIYIKPINMLLLSKIGSSKIQCLVNAPRGAGKEFTHPQKETYFELDDLTSAGTVGNHTLALVGARYLDLHSLLPPFRKLTRIPLHGIILDACFGEHEVVVRSVDQVCVVNVTDPGFSVHNLLLGIPTSFSVFLQGMLYIGVDISFWKDRQKFSNEFSERASQEFQPFRTNDENEPVGAIIAFELNHGTYQPKTVTLHPYVPTGVHKFTNCLVICYGYDGIVAHLDLNSQALQLTSLNSPFKIIGAQANHLMVVTNGMVVVSDRGCRQLIEFNKANKSPPISSATVIDDDVIAYVSRQELRFLAGSQIAEEKLPTILTETSMPVVPSSVTLKMLLIPSQRLLVLHGENICMFYDSITFDQLLVTGITAAWCDNIVLWKFESQGETFEHLAFSSGRGWVESYSFHRDGLTLDCSCKYRAAIFDHVVRQRSNEILYCRNNAIYVARGEYLTMAIPGETTTRVITRLNHEIRCISHTCGILVVTTAKELRILDYARLETLASQPLDELMHSAENNSTDMVIDLDNDSETESGPEDREFLMHVAVTVEENSSSESIYALSLVSYLKKKTTAVMLTKFHKYTKELSTLHYTHPGIDLTKIRQILPDPEMDTDTAHPLFKAYAAMSDNSISSIEVVPPFSNHQHLNIMF